VFGGKSKVKSDTVESISRVHTARGDCVCECVEINYKKRYMRQYSLSLRLRLCMCTRDTKQSTI
jgi:hypothetical protein